MRSMRVTRVASLVLLTASLAACAAKAQVRTEVEVPLLNPPPPPPRVVADYAPEPEPVPLAPAVEPEPVRPPVRPPRPEQKAEPAATTPEPAEAVARPQQPALTLSPSPGSESQTAVAIRNLIMRATRDLARVNTSALNDDGRAQYATARRFIEQAEDALRARNVVFAGNLADKAATMAAVLVR